jgi:WD40 repeat protein
VGLERRCCVEEDGGALSSSVLSQAVAISRDGQLIASGDADGKLIAWYGDSGKSLTQAIKGHSSSIHSLDLSPDGAFVATGSKDKTTKLWNTKAWQMHGNPETGV